jgi:pimeloyl-ACP methyl ester carboxylesterase
MDTVILLHGLWMGGFVLGPMRHRLEDEHRLRVLTFSYPSVSATLGQTVARLRDLTREIATERLHFVGHSLGGVIVLELLRLTGDLPPGRAVLLGSPLCGSTAATTIAHWPMGRSLLGRGLCEAVVDRNCLPWDGRREVGVIAGSTGVGLGRVFAHLDSEHDGTVRVEETRLPGITDHIVLPVTHTGMLISAEVAKQTAHFLREGRFAPQEEAGP